MARPRRARLRSLAAVVLAAATSGLTLADPTALASPHRHMRGCLEMSATAQHEMAALHMEMPGPSACRAYRSTLPTTGWTASATSSAPGHPAGAVLGTHGHAYWLSRTLGHTRRQSLTLRSRTPQTVTGLGYVPGPARRGAVGRFRVSTSGDGRHFTAPVAVGRWQRNATQKQVQWAPRTVRAVRLTILSSSPAHARRVAVRRLILLGPEAPSTTSPASVSPPSVVVDPNGPAALGKWGPTIGFPIIPVAAALVPGNRLVVWSADSAEDFDQTGGSVRTYTAVYDLATGAVGPARLAETRADMFCPGVAILPDGRILVSGGISDTKTSIYDPTTSTWTAGPDMKIGRGYQSNVTLSTGEVFTLGGSWSGPVGGKLGEVWSPSTGWRKLAKVPADPIYTDDPEGVYRADNHGWFFATSGGTVFHAGPSRRMNWITTTGSGSIANAGTRGSAPDEMNGNALMYDVGKILYDGGAPAYTKSDATATAGTIDISGGFGSTPTVAATSSMAYARGFQNSVVLPDGHVFTVGGETHPINFDDETSVMTPEMWSPATGTWTPMRTQPEPRNYHSVALLLPDGTVFSGGGGLCGACKVNHPDAQIYYPPYLFNLDGTPASRPVITSAPATAVTGQQISVTTDRAVSAFVMMRYDESTHTVDTDQRRIPLAIGAQAGTTYTLTLPADPGVAVPGPYLLFALDGHGTPSVASTVVVSAG